MAYLSSGVWIDIYQASDNGAGGLRSAKGATPLTSKTWYEFVEMALAVGKRLPSYAEWLEAAVGSPGGNDGDNTNAWTKTTNTASNPTGGVDRAVSSVGCRDCVGNIYEWTNELITRAEHAVGGEHTSTAWGWDNSSPLGAGYGNIYQYYRYSLVALMAGGSWEHGVDAGARCVHVNSYLWRVQTIIGARAACDSL
jgi:formylglycine-generating enzyme required for sulfatase activity